jgi:putative transposase
MEEWHLSKDWSFSEEVIVTKRFRYRLYPGESQRGQLARVFGCVRVVYNDVVAARQQAFAAGKAQPPIGLLMHEMAVSKRSEERAWLGDVTDVALQQSMRDAERAYQNFNSSIMGKRKGRKIGPPRFKSRNDHRDGFRIAGRQNFSVRTVGQHRAQVRLPKIGWVNFRLSRHLPADPSSLTVIREPDGRYYVSFVVDAPARTVLEPSHQVVGIDLGLKHLATLAHDDGSVVKIENFRNLRKKQRKLATAQKQMARRKKGSFNWEKSRHKVAVLHRKVRETRLDHHHKLARKIVDENQVIGLESLGIGGMARTRLAKSIYDAAWGILVRLIEEKAVEENRTLVRVEQSFPSTPKCSACGAVGERRPLSKRSWNCECGASHDRDVNAAINLRNVAAGQAETRNDCGGHVSPALVPAATCETVSAPVPA